MSVFSKSIDDEDLFLNLQEIDLSSIQTVKLMMEDVVSEKKDSVASYYYVEVDRTQNIFDVTIYKEENRIFWDYDDYRGYYTLGIDTVLIRAPESFKLKYAKGRLPHKFKIRRMSPMPYDPETWYYKIRGNKFGRLVLGIGWFWNQEIVETDKHGRKILGMPAPKRKKP